MSQYQLLTANADPDYVVRLQKALDPASFELRSARTSREAQLLSAECAPDLLILDLDRSPRESVRALADLERIGISPPTLWVSMAVTEAGIGRAKAAGSQGLLSKMTDGTTTDTAIRTVLAGDLFFLADQPSTRTSGVLELGSPGSSERILQLLQDG